MLPEEVEGLVDGHIEDVVNALALIVNVEDLGAETPPVTLFTGYGHILQELHIQNHYSCALAAFTPAPGDVEGEMSSFQSGPPGLPGVGKKVSDLPEHPHVRCWVGSEGLTNGGLVDHDDILNLI